jgi:uncharacterized membrane protein
MAGLARIARHPLHPMLVPFPIALFAVAFLCDIARIITGTSNPYWTLAYYSIGGGLVGALLAALPGFVDYLSLSRPEVRRLGLWHMTTNSAVVLLFLFNFYLRRPSGPAATGGSKTLLLVLSSVGVALLGISGWLGGEMVYVHHAGVDDGTRPKGDAFPTHAVGFRRKNAERGTRNAKREKRKAKRETIYTVITSFSLCSATSLIRVMCWSVSF